MTKEEILERLDTLGKMLYEKCGTDSYEARCYLYDTKEMIKEVKENDSLHSVSKCAHDFIDVDYKIKQCVKCKEYLDLLD